MDQKLQQQKARALKEIEKSQRQKSQLESWL